MKKRFKFLSISFVFFVTFSSIFSQTLTLQEVLLLVRKNHPVAKQAGILVDQAQANLLSSRGAFDPKINYETANKFYGGKNYYDLGNLNLVIPTWPGADLWVGTNTASGVYLNPDETTPAGGLSSIGLTLPILRNLITDQRRNTLRKAKLMIGQNQALKNLQLNELCREVINAYADWYVAQKEYEMYQESKTLANVRLQAIRNEVLAGSKAFIDTLETWVQQQNFEIALSESSAKRIKARMGLSVHLWTDSGQPLEPTESAIPEEIGFTLLDSLALSLGDTLHLELNPNLINSRVDIEMAKLDQRLKKQALLPELNIKYRALGSGAFYQNPDYSLNDYQFGIKFGTSLILRKERGDFQMAKLKTESYELKFIQKQREIQNKTISLWQQRLRYLEIKNNYIQVVNGYDLLYKSELIRMETGESNMFLVNTRELRLIEARLKNIQFKRKYIESNVNFIENSGVLWTLIQP